MITTTVLKFSKSITFANLITLCTTVIETYQLKGLLLLSTGNHGNKLIFMFFILFLAG